MDESPRADTTESPPRRLAWLRSEDGQSAFEFMLMLPFFIFFILLMIEVALLGFSYVSVANAAREGARYGAVNCGAEVCTAAVIEQRVIERSSGIVTDPNDVEVSWYLSIDRGAPVAVSVEQTYDFLFFPFSIPVMSCAEMRLEQREATATVGGSGC
jgi:hypothetical protein